MAIAVIDPARIRGGCRGLRCESACKNVNRWKCLDGPRRRPWSMGDASAGWPAPVRKEHGIADPRSLSWGTETETDCE